MTLEHKFGQFFVPFVNSQLAQAGIRSFSVEWPIVHFKALSGQDFDVNAASGMDRLIAHCKANGVNLYYSLQDMTHWNRIVAEYEAKPEEMPVVVKKQRKPRQPRNKQD